MQETTPFPDTTIGKPNYMPNYISALLDARGNWKLAAERLAMSESEFLSVFCLLTDEQERALARGLRIVKLVEQTYALEVTLKDVVEDLAPKDVLNGYLKLVELLSRVAEQPIPTEPLPDPKQIIEHLGEDVRSQLKEAMEVLGIEASPTAAPARRGRPKKG